MPSDSLHDIPVETLKPDQAFEEHARLSTEIAENDIRYHQEDAPTISDADYDALRRRLIAIEARFPELISAASTSVGAAPSAKFAKVAHVVPMLSLDNAFDDQDVIDFIDRARRFLKIDAADAIPSRPSRRSTGCRCRCAMRAASWSRRRRAAMASRARMSPPTPAPSPISRTSFPPAFPRSWRSAANATWRMPISRR